MRFTEYHGLTNDELLLEVYNAEKETELELELALRLEEMMDEFGPPAREAIYADARE